MVSDKSKILVIDDEPEIVALLKNYLERCGYEIIIAKDGPEGLEKASAHKPDLILLDIIMPKIDGLSILRQLRAEDSTGKLPIILLTAKSETRDIFEAEKYRATDYIVKPVKLSELLKTIKRYLVRYNN